MKICTKLLRQAFKKEPVIILIGQSGCGKGTQLERIAKAYKKLFPKKNLYIAESGQILRDIIPKLTSFNKKILHEIQTAGRLQSWITTSSLWASKFLSEYRGGLTIVDGSPRSVNEAKALVDFYHGFANKEIIVFYLKITDEQAYARMVFRNNALLLVNKKARSDSDTPIKRKTKIAYFHTDVMPAIEYLKKDQNVSVFVLNGMQPMELVTNEILSCLIDY